ncbi:MAG: BglII/BstYI family type II restriction endonuclease [Bacillota bacterium]
MRKVFEYSHLGGSEILQCRFPEIDREIDDIISAVVVDGPTKVSKEKTKAGKMLYSPTLMNSLFKKQFYARGFKELKDTYTISIPNWPNRIKGAYKQIDYSKDNVLVEVQFGKYAFMFYDLAKFQYFFNESKAEVGVEIVPTYTLQKQMSSGVSYGEQLVFDIERLRRHFPSVPVKIIFIDI